MKIVKEIEQVDGEISQRGGGELSQRGREFGAGIKLKREIRAGIFWKRGNGIPPQNALSSHMFYPKRAT